jgi:hypothetical protein
MTLGVLMVPVVAGNKVFTECFDFLQQAVTEERRLVSMVIEDLLWIAKIWIQFLIVAESQHQLVLNYPFFNKLDCWSYLSYCKESFQKSDNRRRSNTPKIISLKDQIKQLGK